MRVKTFNYKTTYILLVMMPLSVMAQITLNADGPGETYALIESQGFGIETPDCEHSVFGEHVTEIFDRELNKNVFVFHSHIEADNDRCSNFDRVRMEIKGASGSPSTLVHTEDQTAYYRWKFRLDSDYTGTSSFNHIFQIKAQGGDAGAPLITITPRADVLQIIHHSGSGSGGLGKVKEVDLKPFLGTWVEAYVEYRSSQGEDGTLKINLKRVSDQSTLLTYNNNSLDMWRKGADHNRPKWGIYRKKSSVLKDEQVRFADFCISEKSSSECP